MIYENGLFIFRRDYRIKDNIGLKRINAVCKNVYTIFIFTPEQVTNENSYKSNNAVQFMIESLEDLETQIESVGGRLHCFYGDNIQILTGIINKFNIDVLGFNYDYTPYALKRDKSITELCKKIGIPFLLSHDYYLTQPLTLLNHSGKPYQKFTPYFNAVADTEMQNPISMKKLHFSNKHMNSSKLITLQDALQRFTKVNEQIAVRGGREKALKQLLRAAKTQKFYKTSRNDLATTTSRLSAYIKFGCVSIREVYRMLQTNHDLSRQLIWRDFYAQVLYAFPHVLGHTLNPSYDAIVWGKNKRYLDAWKNGKTGFPVVDAGMRELNTTGYMHNRARLIVASFLVKTLLIDWREGEKYFATQLTDYDVASNNGNWQWIMGGGADSQPYFRIFNPWSQSEEHDPETVYIKKWIPELSDVSSKDIHNWYKMYTDYESVDYPAPIVDYTEQKKKVLVMYKKYLT